LFVLAASGAGGIGSSQTAPVAEKRAETAAERLDRWQESLELDEASALLLEGRPLVAPGAALAGEARAVCLVARALAQCGETSAARELLERSAAAKPAELVVAERARLALADDELERVLELLWDSSAKALRTPAANEAFLLAARARTRRGEWELAAPLLRRYVELEPLAPETASAWHLLAQEALRRGDVEQARASAAREDSLGRWHAYYRARRLQIRESPREPLPRLGLAQLWLEVGELDKARAVLDQLVLLAPDFARGWMALGETQRKQNEFEQAEHSYDRALSLDATLDIARFNRAMLARNAGRLEGARRDLETLLEGAAGAEARFAQAHLELARLYVQLNLPELAQSAHERYRALGGKESL
jgi:tetratricopeptide (TPR) repeat protein